MATGDPVDRRVIFGTHIVPTYSIEGEEASVRHTEFQVSPAGTFGGKGIASINKDQWGDGWVSFSHQKGYWEEQSDVWELKGETWTGELSITSATFLTDDSSALAFLYIKNTGTSVNAEVALDGRSLGSHHYYIIIPPNGSIHLKGDGTRLECYDVRVRGASGSSTTTIEFIIAKE